jgi:predicted permease
MIPDELFKRRPRHNNTPASVMLIIANFIVTAAALSLFADKDHVNWFFWVIEAGLAVYNFFTIRRNREEFENKGILYSYLFSLALLVVVFFLYKFM